MMTFNAPGDKKYIVGSKSLPQIYNESDDWSQ